MSAINEDEVRASLKHLDQALSALHSTIPAHNIVFVVLQGPLLRPTANSLRLPESAVSAAQWGRTFIMKSKLDE